MIHVYTWWYGTLTRDLSLSLTLGVIDEPITLQVLFEILTNLTFPLVHVYITLNVWFVGQ